RPAGAEAARTRHRRHLAAAGAGCTRTNARAAGGRRGCAGADPGCRGGDGRRKRAPTAAPRRADGPAAGRRPRNRPAAARPAAGAAAGRGKKSRGAVAVARHAVRPDRREPLMLSAQRLDDNPCRPRHFKPPPCAPVIADGAAAELIETSRGRLVLAASLFALVFTVVTARLVAVVALPGAAAEPHLARPQQLVA